ncbi:MAG: fumarylacetoacetate hydrolase family protein [Geminocystis sp.]|nr:fumarylacetoacetate hydrolase family protein [Geminocystis sp.]HIK38115.1 fumarylacetoacetate hydrolase family protein [Geminocystis sp. M7585_C2015_104]MCS7148321.1 fumarylacetoacetate hydrolase family protein [Geminocystis sp.]MCX8077735.1 fumarylacetoacetate hydrolase family protein [Geminocystis sp.]MDW8116627.1 fumarylacetoacetate hydrolase family protein [Geminocystis sp.]
MAQRYVRVKTSGGQTYYGRLQPNRTVEVLDAPPWLNGQVTDQILSSEQYRLLPPCAPSKIIAVGKNYSAHAAEMGSEVPKEPLIFLKPPSAVIAHQEAIIYPKQSQRVDFEGELALVIGTRVKNCPLEEANDKIWGYTIANDVTARDLQKKDGQWTRAKGFDTFCPLGPWIVRELTPGACIKTYLNEDEDSPKQSASISDMVFSPEYLVYYISQIMTLLPGDVILTGTPPGVGPLQVGDVVTVEIESIGKLTNRVIPAPDDD